MHWFQVFLNGFFYLLGAAACCVALVGVLVATLLTIKFLATLDYKTHKK